jgi:hypothetical protein
MKFKKGNYIIEVSDPNTFNIFEREGFKPVEDETDEELEALRAKAKDLGIKGAHNMKKETLILKIAELG